MTETETAPEAPKYYEITLRVKKRYDEKDAATELFYAIREAVGWGNPAGQHLSQEAQRSIVDAVLSTLGVSPFERMPKGTPIVDPMRGVREAVRDLISFIPEGGYPDELGAIGFAHDNVGFFASAEEYQDYLDGKGKDGKGKDGKGERDAAPFFSDPVLYAVCASGKHDGRSIKGHIRSLLTAVGLVEADD